MKRLAFPLALVVASACSKPAPPPAPDASAAAASAAPSASVRRGRFPPPREVDTNGFPKIEGLPDPLACAAAAECEVADPPDESGCCTLSNPTPVAKAYRAAVTSWAKTHCGEYECAESRLPGARPAACFFEARCVAKRCANACSTDGGAPARRTHDLSDTTAP